MCIMFVKNITHFKACRLCPPIWINVINVYYLMCIHECMTLNTSCVRVSLVKELKHNSQNGHAPTVIRPFKKRDVLCYCVVWVGGCSQDSFCSISQEIFDVSSPNLVHRSTRARQRPSSNWVTLTSFSRSQRSFKSTTYERWFPLNIWRNICRICIKFGTQKHQCKTKTNFEPDDLDLIFKVTEVIQGDDI